MQAHDAGFMEMARYISESSPDPVKKVGCVITTSGHTPKLVSSGFNKLAPGLHAHWLHDGARNKVMLHAEQLACIGVSGYDLVAYVTNHPCHICAGILIESKVTTVHCPPIKQGANNLQSYNLAENMLRACGVTVVYHDNIETARPELIKCVDSI